MGYFDKETFYKYKQFTGWQCKLYQKDSPQLQKLLTRQSLTSHGCYCLLANPQGEGMGTKQHWGKYKSLWRFKWDIEMYQTSKNNTCFDLEPQSKLKKNLHDFS